MEEIFEAIARALFRAVLGLLEILLEAFAWAAWEIWPRRGERFADWWADKTRWQRVRILLTWAGLIAGLIVLLSWIGAWLLT